MAEIEPQNIELNSLSANTNSKQIIIRSALSEDAGPIIEYTKEVLAGSQWAVTQSHEFDLTIDKEIQWIEERKDSPGRLVLLALHNDEIIGLVGLENGSRERNQHVGVLGITIRKDWRGCGLGKALLSKLLDWAKANSVIEKVALAVFSNNEAAIGLYKKMGFIEEGRRPREIKFADNRYADDILMYIYT